MALEVTWHRMGGNPNIAGIPIFSEKITLSGSAATSAAAPYSAEVVRLQATEPTRYSIGPAPVATAAAGGEGHYLATGAEVWLPVTALATKVSGIQAG